MSTTFKVKAGDIFFDANGRSKSIKQDEKAAQDVATAILGDPDIDNVKSRAQAEIVITRAISTLQAIQSEDADLDPREEISGIKELLIVPDPADPETQGFFFLTVVTEAGDVFNKLFDQLTFTDLSHILPENLEDGVS